MIKIENYFIVFYLEKNVKEVEPSNLENCLNKIVIKNDEEDKKEWIKDLVTFDIYNWFKSINYQSKSSENKEYIYKDNVFTIEKGQLPVSFNENISKKKKKNNFI